MRLSDAGFKPLFGCRPRCGLILRKRAACAQIGVWQRSVCGSTLRIGSGEIPRFVARSSLHTEVVMDQDTFNLSTRKFLKTVGVARPGSAQLTI